MNKAEQNEIIMRHIDAELKDSPGIQERVGLAFSYWFQNQLMLSKPEEPEEEENEESE